MDHYLKPSIKNFSLPATIVGLMILYIFALTYFAHTNKKDSEYGLHFDNQSYIKLYVEGVEPAIHPHVVYNDLMCSGRKRKARAQRDDHNPELYYINLDVNSRLHALLYIGDIDIPVFVLPEDTLVVKVKMQYPTGEITSIDFLGKTEKACDYYSQKAHAFPFKNPSWNTSMLPSDYGQELAWIKKEQAFLDSSAQKLQLPRWFVQHEQHEITYQEAFYELSHKIAQNASVLNVNEDLLNNSDALLSEYYHRYVKTFIESHIGVENTHTAKKTSATDSHRVTHTKKINKQLDIACYYLKGNALNMYVTRLTLEHLATNQRQIAQEIIQSYQKRCSPENRYARYVKTKIRRHAESM